MAAVFDVSRPNKAYTSSQWSMKEDWYTDKCNLIQLNASPSPAEVQAIAIEIDALLSVARIDYAFASQAYDKYSMFLKIEEKRLFVSLKQNVPAQFAGMKLTVDEMKGVVASVLNTDKWDNTSYTLYQLVQMSSNRYIFMSAIIKLLEDKKDLLITHNGILKIESSLSGMQPNVPGRNQTPAPYDENYTPAGGN